ncbi:MAG: AraC family transcriptional regulator ligand-binding domain-containing protein [Marinobacter sp.]|uniref:AraC family transcriptional regulator ligand-binding domain-containing protein n=1 Tax=Marinobacter sp. AC-23 TaxID=1879031 RepID=UPI0011138593|nr:AraC family transcriptional regulator ligand-binding domain-containing protein [Marinobacter sp. AC-23]
MPRNNRGTPPIMANTIPKLPKMKACGQGSLDEVAIRHLAALFDEYCLQTGLNSSAMLKAARLPTDTLANPESLIPYLRFLNLLEHCAEKSGNPLFGLEYGLYQGVAIFGPILYLIQNARTVGESLQELAYYYHLYSSGAYVGFERQGDLLIPAITRAIRMGRL